MLNQLVYIYFILEWNCEKWLGWDAYTICLYSHWVTVFRNDFMAKRRFVKGCNHQQWNKYLQNIPKLFGLRLFGRFWLWSFEFFWKTKFSPFGSRFCQPSGSAKSKFAGIWYHHGTLADQNFMWRWNWSIPTSIDFFCGNCCMAISTWIPSLATRNLQSTWQIHTNTLACTRVLILSIEKETWFISILWWPTQEVDGVKGCEKIRKMLTKTLPEKATGTGKNAWTPTTASQSTETRSSNVRVDFEVFVRCCLQSCVCV